MEVTQSPGVSPSLSAALLESKNPGTTAFGYRLGWLVSYNSSTPWGTLLVSGMRPTGCARMIVNRKQQAQSSQVK